MKKIMFAICMLFGVAVAANAQQTQQDTTSTNEPSTDYRTDDPAAQDDQSSQQQDDQDAAAGQDNTTQDTETSQDAETNQDAGVSQDAETSQSTEVSADEDVETISVAELPAIVRESLEGQEYSGWTVTSAHKKEKDGKTFYKVQMQNGAESKKVKFDEQGNKIKEMKGDHKDHQ